jgi:broad specificity phosphatase PhoE
MDYDATWRSVFRPECGDTPAPGPLGWTRESHAAELARLAYYRHEAGDKARLDAALAALGFAPATGFSDRTSSTQAFATLDGEGTAWIAWRGTQMNSVIDAAVDLAAWRLRWEGKARVHAGFRWAYRRLSGQIAAWLGDNPHRAVVTTGHSLGAALATLFAADRPEAELIALGSPRVGNLAFTQRFAARRALRVVTGCDGVTEVPWKWMGYVHAGDERYIDRTGLVHADPPDASFRDHDRREAAREARATTSLRRGELPLRSLTDHAPINYISALLGTRENRSIGANGNSGSM